MRRHACDRVYRRTRGHVLARSLAFMAYIVMAYTIMACTVMAYTAMAYIVMAYTGMVYIVMAYTLVLGTMLDNLKNESSPQRRRGDKELSPLIQ